jgi:hypothetical protein
MPIDESQEFLKMNLDVIDEATVKYLHEWAVYMHISAIRNFFFCLKFIKK